MTGTLRDIDSIVVYLQAAHENESEDYEEVGQGGLPKRRRTSMHKSTVASPEVSRRPALNLPYNPARALDQVSFVRRRGHTFPHVAHDCISLRGRSSVRPRQDQAGRSQCPCVFFARVFSRRGWAGCSDITSVFFFAKSSFCNIAHSYQQLRDVAKLNGNSQGTQYNQTLRFETP